MKTIAFTMILLSFSAMAKEACYQVSKQKIELGQICLSKDLKELAIGESVEVKGQIENLDMDFTFVRLQDLSFQNCLRPKDKPTVCHLVSQAWLKLPKPPLNSVGLPSVPSDLYFSSPELTKGYAWSYEFTHLND